MLIAPELLEDVDLLSLDAGNTVIFLDHERLAALARNAGFQDVSREVLIETEGEAKRLATDAAQMTDAAWAEREAPGAAAWGRMVGTMLARAGVPQGALPSLISSVWESHVAHNLWSIVPDGFAEAMARVRAAGVKTVIVSNSEGMLDRLFLALGIDGCFDAVIDSGRVGHEKPGARIFEIACERAGTTASRGLHLGDTYATDVLGARNAGMRTALIDPHGHYDGWYAELPRVPGVVAVARALAVWPRLTPR